MSLQNLADKVDCALPAVLFQGAVPGLSHAL